MAEGLNLWLRQNAAVLCSATLRRAPNMLVDEDDLFEFLALLADSVTALPEMQLANVQSWALTSIGHDARGAYDWLVVLRVLKQEIIARVEKQFPPQETLRAMRQLDDILTYAIIEASQLATDIQRADLIEHMVQLRRQEDRLEETKTKFIAVAAHELKTPLTIIEGYANILRAELKNEPRLNVYLDGFNNGFRRMREVIGDLIDVSLLDLKSFEIKYREINLERLVLMLADSLNKHFAGRQVELVILPFGVPSHTFGDEEKLKKALHKVVMNGLKYTPDGGRVTVTAVPTRQDESSDEMGGFLDIQIMDTGIGIAAENLEMIFEKFGSAADASLHSSSKTNFKGGGPGLGLPIARGIIEAHGGQIWAQSPGHDEETCPGSTFHIELPLWLKEPMWGM
ncbi:MAG TPA: HAMP domain-containing sensor histidine kinase [Chloroflexota bacterium]|nr:HAMP domain-containing sensor histidine kinase [Chloroflexota bacterium]HUM69851.1 HAMP domain-containing sensor histidine kinase [Chloroflexota bacterium]